MADIGPVQAKTANRKKRKLAEKRNVSPGELAMKVTRPRVMVHAAKIFMQGWGGGLRKLKKGLEKSRIGQGKLKCKSVEKEASDSPMGSSRPGRTL